MLSIKEANPWVMWPDSLVDNFLEDPSNKVFDYDGNFEFKLTFSLPHVIEKKSTLFAKLPSYFGIDLEPNQIVLILTTSDLKTNYLVCDYGWEVNKEYNLTISKVGNVLEVLINGESLFSITLDQRLAFDNSSHILFGAGNFPKNGFNLNYLGVDLHQLEISKNGRIISKHSFVVFIHDKSFDETGNCNFIHKI